MQCFSSVFSITIPPWKGLSRLWSGTGTWNHSFSIRTLIWSTSVFFWRWRRGIKELRELFLSNRPFCGSSSLGWYQIYWQSCGLLLGLSGEIFPWTDQSNSEKYRDPADHMKRFSTYCTGLIAKWYHLNYLGSKHFRRGRAVCSCNVWLQNSDVGFWKLSLFEKDYDLKKAYILCLTDSERSSHKRLDGQGFTIGTCCERLMNAKFNILTNYRIWSDSRNSASQIKLHDCSARFVSNQASYTCTWNSKWS